jgi:hypothetical protein
MEETLLPSTKDERGSGGGVGKGRVLIEQLARGSIYCMQLGVSYCIMLLVMYSNGYVILSILIGALVGFAAFARDTLGVRDGGGGGC